ncbi:Ubiquitin carboxyl-terminal hydrolase 43 [Chionoecetes opilio]|uniref:ubiquitinyl hydrolase 1 n=1 Tax=Chionoecetes opilio TaxID=41210 RepID=A0A8J5D542_CHIOP|nr:Ubiquitin carboxyl-terminal hydrolase 43 [Chionoecetes opilio]
MPVARSVSASQLARGGEGGIAGLDGGGGAVLLAPKAHTLDRYGRQGRKVTFAQGVTRYGRQGRKVTFAQGVTRFMKPSMMNGHGEPRRKRPFMSFRLSKKSSKHKEGGGEGREVSQHPGGNGSGGEGDAALLHGNATISENGAESLDGGSDSSSASVKPKKKYLTRVSSFVSRVASKVQGGGPGGTPGAPNTRGRLERSKTISVSDLRTKVEDCVEFVEGRVPGVMGIRNHGNTCFINAVIQCLSHTDVLAEYFVMDQYKHDLARCNKINSKKYGTRGEITEQLAVLLKALWTHDAAEFLMFVLDKVHEDLNTASKRKYKKIKREKLIASIVTVLGREEWDRRLEQKDGALCTVLGLYGDREEWDRRLEQKDGALCTVLGLYGDREEWDRRLEQKDGALCTVLGLYGDREEWDRRLEQKDGALCTVLGLYGDREEWTGD